MKLFKKNKKRLDGEKKEQEKLQKMWQEYKELVEELCPEDFTVRVGLQYDCAFFLKNTDLYYSLAPENALRTTSKKQLVDQIDIICSHLRKLAITLEELNEKK